MKKTKRFDRKNLKARLACFLMIYLDGLNNKKKDRLKKYLDDKLGDVVDYYVRLSKKKNLKDLNIEIGPEEIEKLCPEIQEIKKSKNPIVEPSLQ
jgi:hypothetical protein